MLKRAYNKYLILESKKKKKCNLITRTQVQILRIPMMNKCRHKNKRKAYKRERSQSKIRLHTTRRSIHKYTHSKRAFDFFGDYFFTYSFHFVFVFKLKFKFK